MCDDHFDNPAARLAHVLDRLNVSRGDQSAVDGWMGILEVEDRSRLPAMFGQLVEQLRQAQEGIEALPEDEDSDHLLAYFPAIDKLFGDLLVAGNQPIAHYATQVTDGMVYSMHTAARALRRNGWREPTLDEAGTVELLDLVRQILDEVANSDLPHEVKMFMILRLREVEAALLSVKIVGYSGIEAVLDALLGGGLRLGAAGSKDDKVGNWITRLWAKLQSLAKGASALAGAAKDVEEAYRAIAGS